MLEKILKIKNDAAEEAKKITSGEILEQFRIKYLSRKGALSGLVEDM